MLSQCKVQDKSNGITAIPEFDFPGGWGRLDSVTSLRNNGERTQDRPAAHTQAIASAPGVERVGQPRRKDVMSEHTRARLSNTRTFSGAMTCAMVVGSLLAPPAMGGDLDLIGDRLDGETMMREYLLGEIDRHLDELYEAEDERLAEPVDTDTIEAWQTNLREEFMEAIGGLPDTDTPLNAEVTHAVERDGFIVEKVIYESMPGVHVSAALFLPDDPQFEPPYPGILLPCGHSRTGKGSELYQSGAALAALHGMAALVFDPLDQGERHQLLDEDGDSIIWGTHAHSALGVGAIFLGHNTARFMIHDMVRSLDYMEERPDIDGERLGAMGNSGGGTQTSYIMALDERIKAAAPSCYITSFDRLVNTIGPQDSEQNIFGQLAWGMDHAEYLTMRAPMPVMVCAATDDFFDIGGTHDSVERARRTFEALGYEDRLTLTETEGTHGWHQPLREASVEWMLRWLKDEEATVEEPEDLEVLSDEEILATPEGEVLKLEGARSVFDINAQWAREKAADAETRWAEIGGEQALTEVREVLGVPETGALPEFEIEDLGEEERDGYTMRKFLLWPEDNVVLPAVTMIPDGGFEDVILYVNDEGIGSTAGVDGPLADYVGEGHAVIAVDLRGLGETQGSWDFYREQFGPDGREVMLAYLIGRSYVGMRTADLIGVTLAAGDLLDSEAAIRLVADGPIVSVVGLHAAALEQDLYAEARLNGDIESFVSIVEQPLADDMLVHTVHGALDVYDLPLLREAVGNMLTLD